METKQSIQTGRPYQITSNFPSSDEVLNLGMYIEAEDTANKYQFKRYNISQKISGKTLNGLLIFLKKNNDDNVGTTSIGFKRTINLSEFTNTNFSGSSEFDKSSDKMLVILFHDNDGQCLEHDKEHFYKNLSHFYSHMGTNDYMLYTETPDCMQPFRPRVAGMTIIRKSSL